MEPEHYSAVTLPEKLTGFMRFCVRCVLGVFPTQACDIVLKWMCVGVRQIERERETEQERHGEIEERPLQVYKGA